MDYEKMYKDALSRAMYLKENTDNVGALDISDCITHIFPKLKESEDEIIRKRIILALKHGDILNLEEITEAISWLEKQGEQKSTDKVGPKFKVGYWVVDSQGLTHQIERVVENVTTHTFGYDIVGGGYFNDDNEGVHLWTIQDAKDGDVLAFDNDTIVMFKDLYNSTIFHSYCHIEDGVFDSNKDELPDWWESEGFKPATKEQRDLLFQKMKEAGYEWNAEKKELKKIKIITPLFNVGDTIIKKHNSDIHDFGLFTITDITGGKYWYNDRIICDITEQDEWEFYEPVRQKPAWSEEDERMRNASIRACQYMVEHFENSTLNYENAIDWLKSLKDRVKP